MFLPTVLWSSLTCNNNNNRLYHRCFLTRAHVKSIKTKVTHLLPLTVFLDHPVDDVGVHLSEHKRSVVLYSQISLLDGRHWTRTAAELTWRANTRLVSLIIRPTGNTNDEMMPKKEQWTSWGQFLVINRWDVHVSVFKVEKLRNVEEREVKYRDQVKH